MAYTVDILNGPDRNGVYIAKIDGKKVAFGPTTNSNYMGYWFVKLADKDTVYIVRLSKKSDVIDALKKHGVNFGDMAVHATTHGLWNVND